MTASETKQSSLTRSLRAPGLIVHYVTSVIGVGVLIIPGHAAAAAGPLSLLAWLILVIYSYPFALIFARLSMRHPTSRGIPAFIEHAYGRRASQVSSVFLVLTLLVANPVLGLAAFRYLYTIWDPAPSNLMVIGYGFLFVLGSILFNLLGIKVSTRVQAVLLGCLIGFLVLVIVVSLPHADTGNLTPFAPHGWMSVGSALIICFFGFIGWENAAPVAEEVVDPQRTFPRAIFLAVFLVGVLYFMMALTVVLVVPSEAASGEQITAFSTLLKIASGRSIAIVGNIVAVILLVLATNAWVLGTSRVIYATARDGLLPKVLTKVSARHSVPWAALLFLVPGYGVFLAILAISGEDETMIITASSAAFLVVFLVTFLAARKILVGRGIRALNMIVIVVTAAILPFFGESLLYAGAFFVIALGLILLRERRTGANRPNRDGSLVAKVGDDA
ncbi:amino acid permease [Actinoplanes lobatus]|uniref:Amino acid efflux transporter n=1 Tax=Actinoplanes lobatus TaxID=113568 RepID=A0A7W7HBD9_9ACTN|nr:APC family permease [Actinoplanes lobatus]MBB4747449.1 amino acid efflux transporter [Actinoplanes lobatus]GGN78676.1 amino acid permease [Actinoplanes lobatus]GIE45540.1 amino acid permease [Actinoplanes lobatus]